MLKKIRTALAVLFLIGITVLLLDITGALNAWLGWMAKIQFLPAVLALNVAVVAALVLLTLVFGRLYCSVICPLGIFQDVVSHIGGKAHKFRFSYKKENRWLRYGVLAAFIILLVAGASQIAALIAPYSAYGRIVTNLFAPISSDIVESRLFYAGEHAPKSLPTLIVAAVTLVLIVILAWKGGRTWCNNICPVGTILGLVSRFAIFRPVFDLSKCNGCKLCSRNCKSSCIDPVNHKIDYSRCVVCFDCIGTCRKGAISYKPFFAAKPATQQEEAKPAEGATSRRNFLAVAAMVASAATLEAQEKQVEGSLAILERKKAPVRAVPIHPAGSESLRHFSQHCTACQLCVTSCPNKVLRPSVKFDRLMQPEMSFELGYCRPECTTCSQVCPAGAIKPVTPVDKSSIQIGHAVWIQDNCVVVTDKVSCGNCARHCPAGAIRMVAVEEGSKLKVPSVNAERCIGCGSCEYHCPARPVSAIHVEGNEVHRVI